MNMNLFRVVLSFPRRKKKYSYKGDFFQASILGLTFYIYIPSPPPRQQRGEISFSFSKSITWILPPGPSLAWDPLEATSPSPGRTSSRALGCIGCAAWLRLARSKFSPCHIPFLLRRSRIRSGRSNPCAYI